MKLTRRHVVLGGLGAGALVVGWNLVPHRFAPPLTSGTGETLFNAYVKIGREGSVIVGVPQCEMGQGVATLIPQIVAHELGADWRQVAVELAPVSGAYANVTLMQRWATMALPLNIAGAAAHSVYLARREAEGDDFMTTADGTSLANYERPAREAAAAARALLAQAAAARWDVAWEQCETREGFVVNGERRLRFAELAEEAAAFDVPDPVPLRAEPVSDPGSEFEGDDEGRGPSRWPRLDLPAKVDGSLNFAGDVRLPDMVFASIRHGPMGDTRLDKIDKKAAAGITGVVSIVRNTRWVAVAATNWWAAEKAVRALSPTWKTAGPMGDSERIERVLAEALDGPGKRLVERGDIGAAFGAVQNGAPKGYKATYEIAPASHAAIETATATARFADGRLELWIASQAPQAARRAAAEAIGIGEDDVVLYPMMAGGSFDARLDVEVARDAAQLAQHLKRPVQVVWSRSEETMRDFVRPPAHVRVAAMSARGGGVAALSVKVAAPATAREFGRRLFDNAPAHAARAAAAGEHDWMMVEGGDPSYAIPDFALDHHPADIGQPTGRSRGNAHVHTCFAIESFIDELAERAKREPLGFRIEMLGQDEPLVRCLTGVGTLAEWGGGGDNSGQGLACHRIGEGRIAVIATASRGERGLVVERLSAVLDIGRIVNRDIARQQVEGGLVFGLAAAMGGATEYAGGMPVARRLSALDLPRLGDIPRIDIAFIESGTAATGEPIEPGDLAVAPVGPAIANALFSATGLRFRRLPLLSSGL